MSLITQSIKVDYEYTSNTYQAQQWLNSLPDLFAVDTEVASKFTKTEKEIIKYKLSNFNLSFEEKRILQQQHQSNGLSHPSLTVVTHLVVAHSEDKAKVIICTDDPIRNLMFNFLVTTDKKQIWHNAQFDFKHIYYHTGKLPKNYEDTMLLAKSLLNNANSFEDKVGLKTLMGYCYSPKWSLKENINFTLESIWNLDMIAYCATDAVATYKLYKDILDDLSN